MILVEDEALFKAVSKVLTNQPIDEVIPVLVVATARAMVLEADGDRERLQDLGARFCSLLAKTTLDMFDEETVH